MEFIQTLVGFVGALMVLVSVHEFGHYYVARRCGVKVLRFCVGMGTPFWSYKDRHGTEFGLAPLPLGGYVKMLDEREGEVAPSDLPYTYNNKPVWARIAILAAGPLANFILAFVVFSLLAGFQGQTDAAPVIGQVEKGSVAAQAGLSSGQEILSVDGVATSTRQSVLEQLLMRLGETGVVEMTLADPQSDMTFESEIPLNRWLSKAQDPNPMDSLGFDFFYPNIKAQTVTQGDPAELAGIQAGDLILGADDVDAWSRQEWIDYVKERPNQPIVVKVERAGKLLDIPVTPKAFTMDDGAVIGRVGVTLAYDAWPDQMIRHQNYGVFGSLSYGLDKTWGASVFVLVSMKKLLFGQISTKNLSGPIGIAKVAGDRAKAGFVYFVEFLALLSISLGVLNLLPIPILDGGHIVYCLVEAIKGSPVSESVQRMGFSAGLAMLACVMVLALYNDILRF